jgi:hypothetical protein
LHFVSLDCAFVENKGPDWLRFVILVLGSHGVFFVKFRSRWDAGCRICTLFVRILCGWRIGALVRGLLCVPDVTVARRRLDLRGIIGGLRLFSWGWRWMSACHRMAWRSLQVSAGRELAVSGAPVRGSLW